MAELAAGPHATADPAERARRQDRLQRAEATFEPLPVDAGVARAYGRVYARTPRTRTEGSGPARHGSADCRDRRLRGTSSLHAESLMISSVYLIFWKSCRSDSGLALRPVTPEVAGSSPVGPAKLKLSCAATSRRFVFCVYFFHAHRTAVVFLGAASVYAAKPPAVEAMIAKATGAVADGSVDPARDFTPLLERLVSTKNASEQDRHHRHDRSPRRMGQATARPW